MNTSRTEILQEYELVKKAQKNLVCFSDIYAKFHKNIFVFIYKKVRSREVAADITSYVFLKAMTNIKSYTFRGSPFGAWLYRIAFNEVVMHVRKNHAEKILDKDVSDFKTLSEEQYDFESEEKIKAILNCINEQSDEIRKLIQLRFFKKMKFSEIAHLMGLTENNVKIKLFRIINKLKSQLLSKA